MLENGIGLEKFTTLIGTGLHGNHPAYDKYVIKRLDDFASQVTNFTPEQANNFKYSNFKFFYQLDEKDCRPTCLRMIGKYYGKNIGLNFLNKTRLF